MAGIAMAALVTACGTDPSFRDGMTHLSEGQTATGLMELRRAAEANPGNAVYREIYLQRREEAANRLLTLADGAIAAGQFDEAGRWCDQLAGFWPNHPRLPSVKQRIAEQAGQASQLARIETLIKQGERAEALQQVQLALRDRPDQPRLLDLRRSLQEGQSTAPVGPSLTVLARKPVSLEFRDANLKMVLEALSRGTGLNYVLDRDVRPELTATLMVHDVPLEDAIDLILTTNRLRKKILNTNTILVYPDTPEKVAAYQDLVMRSFYLTNVDAKRMAELLKTMLKLKYVFVDDKLNIVTVRDTPEAVALAARQIANQDLSEPEVMLELEVLEVSRSRLTNLGIKFPSDVTLTPLPSGSGGSLLLNDVRQANSRTTAVSGATLNIKLVDNDGDVDVLASPRIRARNHEKANVLVGSRVPFVTATTTATGVVSESVQYQDVGLKLDAEPSIYLDNEVGIKMSLEVSSLGTQLTTSNGTVAYQITTRNASTVLRLRDGETQILAGLLSDEERRSADHLPGLGDIPLIGRLFSQQKRDRQKTEIMLAITPHIVRGLRTPDAQDATLWTGTEAELRVAPLRLESGSAKERGGDAVRLNLSGTPEAPASSTEPSPAPSAAAHARVSLIAPKQVLRVGESMRVSVVLDSPVGVRGVPVQLATDPKTLAVGGVKEGGYFRTEGAASLFNGSVGDAEGRIFGSTASPNANGVKGSGELFSFQVTGRAPGRTQLEVTSVSAVGVTDPAPVVDPVPPLSIEVQ